jgi:hypothetical protein
MPMFNSSPPAKLAPGPRRRCRVATAAAGHSWIRDYHASPRRHSLHAPLPPRTRVTRSRYGDLPRRSASLRSTRSRAVRSYLLHSRSCRNESRRRLSFPGASGGSGDWIAS